MPVRLTHAAPAEWPVELTPIGKRGATRREALDRYAQQMRERKTPSTQRQEPVESVRETEPAPLPSRGQQMEDVLFAEAEEAARLTRWRRRQLEAKA